jgi:3D (Asp-Asp-Asp) domain-containing protein
MKRLILGVVAAAAVACSLPAQAGSMNTSWYRARLHNGVANNHYPVGTRLLISYHGRSVVEGTGPFVRGRSLDVSKQIASHLGFIKQGTARLEVIALK